MSNWFDKQARKAKANYRRNEQMARDMMNKDILNPYQQPMMENIKMTRQEAIKITQDIMGYHDTWTAENCIKCFEALGIMKFDEEAELIEAVKEARAANLTNKGFIEDMEKRGYKIVKK